MIKLDRADSIKYIEKSLKQYIEYDVLSDSDINDYDEIVSDSELYWVADTLVDGVSLPTTTDTIDLYLKAHLGYYGTDKLIYADSEYTYYILN